jgi:branched-chain amino acid transport system permease protein
VFAHYATHIEHNNFGILLATFAIAYPIIGGLSSLAGTLLAVIFVQGFLLEGLRFLGEWRSLLFGALIVVVMLVRPSGFLRRSLGLGLGQVRGGGGPTGGPTSEGGGPGDREGPAGQAKPVARGQAQLGAARHA